MIRMLVGNQDCTDRAGVFSSGDHPLKRLASGNAGVHQNACRTGRNQGAISATAAGQH